MAARELGFGRNSYRLKPFGVQEWREFGAVVGEQLARRFGACVRGDQLCEVGKPAHEVDARHDLESGGVGRSSVSVPSSSSRST